MTRTSAICNGVWGLGAISRLCRSMLRAKLPWGQRAVAMVVPANGDVSPMGLR